MPGVNVNVYPNPAGNQTTIYISNETINQKGLSLYDTHGKTYPVRMVGQVSKHAVVMDVSGLSSGVYFVRVKVEDGYKTISFVKK
ncbi:MAG: T9SS type A sorting domain-containing protein [Ferruginibacter sp.]